MKKIILMLLGLLFFPHILDHIGLLLGFFLSKWSYSNSFKLGLKKKFKFRGFKFYFRSIKLKKIIYNIFGPSSGGSFEPPGLHLEPPPTKPDTNFMRSWDKNSFPQNQNNIKLRNFRSMTMKHKSRKRETKFG